MCLALRVSRILDFRILMTLIEPGPQHLRRRGIVHRDLNPKNIMSAGILGRKNTDYLLGDLGLSFLVSGPDSEKARRVSPDFYYLVAC